MKVSEWEQLSSAPKKTSFKRSQLLFLALFFSCFFTLAATLLLHLYVLAPTATDEDDAVAVEVMVNRAYDVALSSMNHDSVSERRDLFSGAQERFVLGFLKEASGAAVHGGVKTDEVSNSTALISSSSLQPLPFRTYEVDTSTVGRRKPIMYLHVGPFKTGTSFLQCSFARNGYDLLQQDNILYLGTCSYDCRRGYGAFENSSMYEFCLGHSGDSLFGGTKSKEILPELQEKFNQLLQQGRNGLIVWEYFSDMKKIRLQNLMKSLEGWDVRVIIHYRRLYEWLPSFYGQLNKPCSGREQFIVWPGDQYLGMAYRKGEHVRGLSKPGDVVHPFEKQFPPDLLVLEKSKRFKFVLRKILSNTRHPTDAARLLWSNYVKNITIVNLHHLPRGHGTGDPLLTYLFCTVIPTHHTCEAAKNNEIDILQQGSNERFPVNYDLLAVEAHKRGLQPPVGGSKPATRRQAFFSIRHRQESVLNKTSHDFSSLICMSNESLDNLLSLSWAVERNLFPDLEEEHRQGFGLAVQKKKYCHINASAILDHEDWRDFFQPFVPIEPRVVQRISPTKWTDLRGNFTPFQAGFYLDQHKNLSSHRYPQVEFIGFLHISQTIESTPLWNFLSGTVQSERLANSLSRRFLARQNARSSINCFFGPKSAGTMNARASQSCHHARYSTLVTSWTKALYHLQPFKIPGDHTPVPKSLPIQAWLFSIAMVRDPLDRWMDYYNILLKKKATHHNSTMDDLEQWLEQLAHQPDRHESLYKADQYQYLDSRNVDTAISMIQGESASVLVLVQECWEASLLLLGNRFPGIVGNKQRAIDYFLGRQKIEGFQDHNTTSWHYYIHRDRSSLNITSKLRSKARLWYADDYKFYDAARVQFRKLLATSGLQHSEVESCLEKLSL